MIGLLTPYNVQNYGTKLQAYAVQEITKDYDHVEIINFRPNFFERVKRKIEHRIRGKKYSDSKSTSLKTADENLLNLRNKAIESFNIKLKITSQVNGLKNLKFKAQQYNAVICGSDQIWNPVNLPEHIFMLEFVPKKVKRIALSPSFGVPEIPKELFSTYKQRLMNIEYMSVREKKGCEIVKKLGLAEPCWTLDPTLILQENKWDELANESNIEFKEPYIFCYFLGSHALGRNGATRIKELTGFKIINLPHFKSYVDADINFADYDLYDVSTQDFIKLIKNAQYVCTDSFHGTAFSLVFEKEFICYERHNQQDAASTNERIYSILDAVKNSSRLVSNIVEVESLIDNKINYETVKKILNQKRDEANTFLSNAIRGERHD